MDDPSLNESKPINKTLRKVPNLNLIKKLNRSVNLIASKAYESQQAAKTPNFYSRNMLCTARMTPKHEPFKVKQNEIIQTLQTNRSSAQKVHKRVRLAEEEFQKLDAKTSMTLGENFYSTRKQNNNQSHIFLTMQENQSNNNFNATCSQLFPMTQTQNNGFSKYRVGLKVDRNWSFEQFLNHLYLQKAKDLKTKPNPKQQILFVERYKEKFERYTSQQLIHEVENGRTTSCAIREINVPGSDFSLNAIRCICEFMLSNKIVKISSSEINSFCVVKTIILDKNPMGDEAVGILAQSLSYFKVLEKLSIVSVNMSSRGSKKLLKGLTGLEHLKHVNFSSEQGLNRNRFGESTQALQNILSDDKCSWEYLNMSNSNIGEGGLSRISNGITKGTKLTELLLGQNDIVPEDISYFLSKVKFSHLVKLDLSRNQIGDEGFKMIAEVIGTQYGHNTLSRSLKILNVSDNQIRSYGIEFYCKNMFNNNALTELYLANNILSKGEQFFNFKYYITKNWTLKKLDLSNCFNDLEDMRHLFEGMEENRALLELKVNRNNFSVQSFVAMAKMLTTNKSLKVLEMESCNITDKFIQKAEKQLKEIRNIEHINWSNNYLSDKCGKILIQMVNKGKSLTKLTFLKNCLGVRVQTQIASILKGNKNLKEHSKIDQKQMEYLKYVSEIQSTNEENIKSAIEKLREKQEKAKLSSLVCQVVKAQLQEESYKKQLQQEMNKIKHLEHRLMRKAIESNQTSLRSSKQNLPEIRSSFQ